MILSNYKAVIFDWDGTLVDTCGLVLDAHNHVRAHYGHPLWSMDDFLGNASNSAREYYPTIYGDNADEAQEILYEYVGEHHLKYLKPMPDVADLLNFIAEAQIPMGIVSNKRDEYLKLEVTHTQWQGYFEGVIGAGVAKNDKPAADPLFLLLAQMDGNLIAKDILFVGDTETDLLCAQNAPCDIALIQSDKPRPDLVEKYQPKYSCLNLREFIDLLSDPQTAKNKACQETSTSIVKKLN